MTAPNRTAVPVYADTQGHLIITTAPDTNRTVVGKKLIEAGAINVAGDYECGFATDGVNVIEVELKPSAVTGSVTPTLVAPRYQGNFASSRAAMQAAGVAFVAGTAQILTLSDIRGKKFGKVLFTIPGAGSITFDPGATPSSPSAIAEFNCL